MILRTFLWKWRSTLLYLLHRSNFVLANNDCFELTYSVMSCLKSCEVGATQKARQAQLPGALYPKAHTYETLPSVVCSAVFLFLSSLYRDRPPDAYESWLNNSLDMVQSAVTGKQTNLCSSWGCLGIQHLRSPQSQGYTSLCDYD